MSSWHKYFPRDWNFCARNPPVFFVLCCQPQQAVEPKVDLPVIWETLYLRTTQWMWRGDEKLSLNKLMDIHYQNNQKVIPSLGLLLFFLFFYHPSANLVNRLTLQWRLNDHWRSVGGIREICPLSYTELLQASLKLLRWILYMHIPYIIYENWAVIDPLLV